MFDFTQTRLSWRRPIQSYSKVQRLLSALLRNRKFHLRQSSIQTKDFLDVGCGSHVHDNFINLDYGWHPGIDICWDITRGIPLPDNAVRGIFTEHCLEHLTLQQTDQVVLPEFFRVLKPGGTVRIIVPDGELYLTRYGERIDGGTEVMPYADGDIYCGLYSSIMSVNRIFRGHDHKFIYDFATLRLLLQKHLFVDVHQESYGHGREPALLIDTEFRMVESLYVEATKPFC